MRCATCAFTSASDGSRSRFLAARRIRCCVSMSWPRLRPIIRLAAQKKVRIAELADTPLILYPKHQNAQFKRTVQSLYRDAGVTPFVAHQAYEIQTAIALVAPGLGVTFVGESVARHGRTDVVFRHLSGPGLALVDASRNVSHRSTIRPICMLFWLPSRAARRRCTIRKDL